MKTRTSLLLGVSAAILLFLVGCVKQSYVSVDDSKGIEEGAPVIWYEGDAYVGKVSQVKEVDGRFNIYIDFHKNYEGTIRAGVRACPMVEPKISGKPILLLVGGKDASMPLLEPGSQIPEISLDELQRMKQMSFMEWFGSAKMGLTIFVGVLVVVLLVVCLVKLVAKLVRVGLFLAAIAIIAFYVCNLSVDWKQYQEQASKYVKEIKIEEVQDWLQKHYSELKNNIPELMQKINVPKVIEEVTKPAVSEQSQNTDSSQDPEPQK